jgi:predicted CoA-binding protein
MHASHNLQLCTNLHNLTACNAHAKQYTTNHAVFSGVEFFKNIQITGLMDTKLQKNSWKITKILKHSHYCYILISPRCKGGGVNMYQIL